MLYPEMAARHAAAADRAGQAIARAFLQTVQPARAAAAAGWHRHGLWRRLIFVRPIVPAM
jgi:hypothetical protein